MSTAVMRLLLDEANSSGIDTYEIIRNSLISERGSALDRSDFHTSLLLSHAIWWMTAMHDRLDPS